MVNQLDRPHVSQQLSVDRFPISLASILFGGTGEDLRAAAASSTSRANFGAFRWPSVFACRTSLVSSELTSSRLNYPILALMRSGKALRICAGTACPRVLVAADAYTRKCRTAAACNLKPPLWTTVATFV